MGEAARTHWPPPLHDSNGRCSLCSNSRIFGGGAPCPYCCEKEAMTFCKWVVFPGMVLSLLAAILLAVSIVRMVLQL